MALLASFVLVAGGIGCQTTPEEGALSRVERLDAIATLFRASWPYVAYPGSWADDLYNSHEELEREWWGSDLHGHISLDELHVVRGRVEDWRDRYQEWVEGAAARLSGLSESDPHYEMVQAVHSRGARILAHVDAILSSP